MEVLALREKEYACDPDYMRHHPDLSPRMRSIVVDWMMGVAHKYVMQRETLHCAVNLFDRTLGLVTNVTRAEVQLFAVTALWIACKMEEDGAIVVTDFVAATDKTYSAAEIICMERFMVDALDWRLNPPTVAVWAWHLLDDKSGFASVMRDLDEVALDIKSLALAPSALAAAAIERCVVIPNGTCDTLQTHDVEAFK